MHKDQPHIGCTATGLQFSFNSVSWYVVEPLNALAGCGSCAGLELTFQFTNKSLLTASRSPYLSSAREQQVIPEVCGRAAAVGNSR